MNGKIKNDKSHIIGSLTHFVDEAKSYRCTLLCIGLQCIKHTD